MRTPALILSSLFLGTLAQAATPRASPPFTLLRNDAAPLELSHFRGKVVALAFIHTTCSHCQDLSRILKIIQKDYEARNVQVVVCAFEVNASTNFPLYVAALQPNFAAGYSTSAAMKKYVKWNDKTDGILMVPYMIFIDAGGIIRGDFNGKDGFFNQSDTRIRAELDKMTKPAARKN